MDPTSGRLARQRQALVVDRRASTERRMSPMRVVPALQPIKDRHLRLCLAREAATAEYFTLKSREETLGHRVVVRITHRAHRRHDACFLAPLAEGVAGVLTAVIRVVD